jgi:tetratricopeptide (TPR) repeat protein
MPTNLAEAAPVERLIAALAAHRAGRAAEAEREYRAVLGANPGHPAALRLLGLLLLATGRAGPAVPVLRAAVAAQPDDAEAGTALADALAASGVHAAAIAGYRAVLAGQPGHHAARVNLANALRDAGDPAAAIAECRLALATAPRLPAAHLTLGSALLAAGRVVEAIGAYRTAAGIDPAAPEALVGLAMALLRDRRAVDALDAAQRAAAATPGLAEAWFVRGAAEHALLRHKDAAASLARALAADPGHARARLALGNVLADLDQLEPAADELRRAIAADPALPEAHASLGLVLAALGRPDEAASACDAAIALRPGFARAHCNRAIAHLLAGNWAQGWADHEWRRADPLFAADFPALDGPAWDGWDLSGRTLLVWAAPGQGEAILLARYLPLLAASGARVLIACAPPLRRLLATLPGVTAIAQDAPLPSRDAWIFQTSLPLLFATTPDSIPAAGGYLAAEPPAGDAPTGALRVGLAWAGDPRHALPTDVLAPFALLPGIAWTNLQPGGKGTELAIMHRMPPPHPGLADLADAAACIAGLDLVVTADTAIAHLAGALGKPVWIMLPHAPCWHWLLHREDSPWYASARLFRQPAPGDWSSVVARIAKELPAFHP